MKCLSNAINTSDHIAVYESSRLLLRDRPEDVQYQQCFILSSIKLSRSEEVAHQYFKQPPSNQILQHLYAYYLYDRGEFSQTIDYINSIKHSGSLKLLLAQAHFRSFKYD